MVELTALEHVLWVDAGNVIKADSMLEKHLPEAKHGIESFARAFEEVAKLWGKVSGYNAHHEKIDDWIERLGMDLKADHLLLERATLIGVTPEDQKAQESLHEAVAIVVRSYLALRLSRDFLFAVSELYRLRVTAATGYLRVQSETAALLKLMAKDPVIAQEWLNISAPNNPGAGKRFHEKWHRKIKREVVNLGLEATYQEASNLALHSRPGGVVRGILAGNRMKPGSITLNFQEITDSRFLVIALLPVLRFHRRILEAFEQLFPEIEAASLDTLKRPEIYAFVDRVGLCARDLWEHMKKTGALRGIWFGEANVVTGG